MVITLTELFQLQKATIYEYGISIGNPHGSWELGEIDNIISRRKFWL
jgi:hypothetical protein